MAYSRSGRNKVLAVYTGFNICPALLPEENGKMQAADLMGMTQPRVSDVMRGKIDLFSLDALVNMSSAAGRRVEMRLAKAA